MCFLCLTFAFSLNLNFLPQVEARNRTYLISLECESGPHNTRNTAASHSFTRLQQVSAAFIGQRWNVRKEEELLCQQAGDVQPVGHSEMRKYENWII